MGGFFPGGVFKLQIPDGTVAAPGFPYASDLTTGFYRPANGYFGLSIAGGTGGLIDNRANVGFGRFVFSNLNPLLAANNTAYGQASLQALTSGAYNTALGLSTLNHLTTGGSNISIGPFSCQTLITGSNNVAIGPGALASNAAGSLNVCLGNGAGGNELGSNTLYIANSGTATPLIGGVFDPAGGFVGTLVFNAASHAITDGVNTTTVKPGGVVGNVVAAPGVGFIGESVSAQLLQANAANLTTSSYLSIVSITLQPGTWDLDAFFGFVTTTTTSVSAMFAFISTQQNTIQNNDSGAFKLVYSPAAVYGTAGIFTSSNVPTIQATVTVATTYYLTVMGIFTASTLTAFGKIYARRTG